MSNEQIVVQGIGMIKVPHGPLRYRQIRKIPIVGIVLNEGNLLGTSPVKDLAGYGCLA